MNIASWIIGFLFIGFCIVMAMLEHNALKEDAEEERRRFHKMLVEMPSDKADMWLRNTHLPGPRCACGTYNLKYTTTVKANEADHQRMRCQPAWERIEVKGND